LFFVISGYLIGKHLMEDIRADRLSFWAFYAKRIRRLFPSLATVLVATWVIGYYLYSASEFISLGRHTIASVFFSNNFLLWTEAGYFDALAETKPLLHLWSLGVEEQFYLIAPFVLWWGSRARTVNIFWVVRLGFLSLLTLLFASDIHANSSFYLLHTRFWELAAGVLIGYFELHWSALANATLKPSRTHVRELCLYGLTLIFTALLGLLATDNAKSPVHYAALVLLLFVGAGVFYLARIYGTATWLSQFVGDDRCRSCRWLNPSGLVAAVFIVWGFVASNPRDWPGVETFVPVAGAAILLALSATTLVNRLLSFKPLVWMGGISYPLYLWHWPLLVYWRASGMPTDSWHIALVVACAIGLAWITKVMIEDPVRFGSKVTKRPRLIAVLGGLVFAGSLGATTVALNGLSSRFPPEVRALAEWSETDPDKAWRVGRCYYYLHEVEAFADDCTPAKRTGVPRILLWGDSHAAHLYTGLIAESNERFDIVQWTSAGCPPTSSPLIGEGLNCAKRRAFALAELKRLSPDQVILSGAWVRYSRSGNSLESISSRVSETVVLLQDAGVKRILLVGPGPVWKDSLSIDLFRHMASRRGGEVPRRFGEVDSDIKHLENSLKTVARTRAIDYLSVLEILCNDQGCITLGDGIGPRPDLLFRDRDHFTESGSRYVVEHGRQIIFGQK